MKIAVTDDWQDVAKTSADWSRLENVTIFTEPFASEAAAIEALKPFDIWLPMRERTALHRPLLEALPNLKMIALTGVRAQTLDVPYCNERGITVSHTGGDFSLASTSELAWALVIGSARDLHTAHEKVRAGGWNRGVDNGIILSGKRLGIVGLGKLGSKVASYGKAFGMEVVAWSENLTSDKCIAAGVKLVSKEELFKTSDVISLHLVLSARTKHIVGAGELAMMKHDAILVNTSRGPLVDEAALIKVLQTGSIRAGLDVFDIEPMPQDHILRKLPNVFLSPHLGYAAAPAFKQFYCESIVNIEAFLAGKPIKLITQK
jgi:phosphoglycerate dehydrogenase-like enzyme